MWATVVVLGSIALIVLLLGILLHIYVVLYYIPHAVRIFQEKPLFIIPTGQPLDDAEAVSFPTGAPWPHENGSGYQARA